jgi:hypothetical protein
LLLRQAHRFVGLQHAEHAAVRADDANLWDTDAVIDANLKATLLLAGIEAGTAH